jgi:hypothetical protein
VRRHNVEVAGKSVNDTHAMADRNEAFRLCICVKRCVDERGSLRM